MGSKLPFFKRIYKRKTKRKGRVKVPSGPITIKSVACSPISKKQKMKEKFDVQSHRLVPKHIKLTEEEKNKLLEKYNISIKQLPKIDKTDSAIKDFNFSVNDVLKIIRKNSPNGEVYYRVVIDG